MTAKMKMTVSALGATALAIATVATLSLQVKADHHNETAVKSTSEEPSMASIGDVAPDFTLTDTAGKTHHLADYLKDGNIVVLEWFNPDCPFVKKHHALHDSMAETFKFAKGKDVVWLAINSGAPGKQGHGVERNTTAKKDYSIEYPILLDETGDVGKMYGAKTTPHMMVIDDGKLVYRGPLDNDRSPQKVGDTNYVKTAIQSCEEGKAIAVSEERSYGCSVKYAS